MIKEDEVKSVLPNYSHKLFMQFYLTPFLKGLIQMFSYMGKILRINLSNKKVSCEPLKDEITKKFIGGRGFGAWILWSELPPKVNALGSENKMRAL
jgi:hypothetical protein